MTAVKNTTETTFPSALDAIVAWNPGKVSNQNMQSCSNALSSWQQEGVEFLQKRIAENGHTLTALLASKDLAEITKTQQDWLAKAAADYAKEATRIVRLATIFSFAGTPSAVQNAAMQVD